MAGVFPDWAGRTFGEGLDDGVGILRWYAVEATWRKGEGVSSRRGRRVCGEGFTGVWAPDYAGMTGEMERGSTVTVGDAGRGGSCR